MNDNKEINLKIVEDVASTKIKSTKFDNFSADKLLLESLYYYSLKENKILNINSSFESIKNFLLFGISNFERYTDALDTIYQIHKRNGENGKFEKTYEKFYANVCSNKRWYEDLQNAYLHTFLKIEKYNKSFRAPRIFKTFKFKTKKQKLNILLDEIDNVYKKR